MSGNAVRALVALAVVGAVGWSAWDKLEWLDERRWVPAEPAVEQRPMLAAGLFLQAQGFAVSRVLNQTRLDAIPDGVDTYFVCEARQRFSRAHFDEIQRWLNAGGHLVLNASGTGELMRDDDFDESQDSKTRGLPLTQLLHQRGIENGNRAAEQNCWHQAVDFEPLDDSDSDVQAVPADDADDEALVPVAYRGALPGLDAGTSGRVVFEAANWLEGGRDADWVWRTERGVQLLSQPVGAGRLTVMADFSPLFNAGIGEGDNALALQALVAAHAGPDSRVWFHERELAFPSLAAVIWQRAPQLVVLALLAAVLCGWALFARRQEVAATPVSEHSQLRLQLSALAAYRWRVRDRETLGRLLQHQPGEEALEAPRSRAQLTRAALRHWRSRHAMTSED